MNESFRIQADPKSVEVCVPFLKFPRGKAKAKAKVKAGAKAGDMTSEERAEGFQGIVGCTRTNIPLWEIPT